MNQEWNNNEYIETVEIEKNKFKAGNPKAKNNKFAKKIGTLALSGLILGTTVGGAFTATTYLFSPNTAVTQPANSESKGSSSNLTTTLTNFTSDKSSTSTSGVTVEDIATKGLPSIVAITNKGVSEVMTMWGNMQQESESCGSGIIIGKSDTELLMATNYHVIENSNTLTVVFSYDESSEEPNAVEAYVKGYDSNRDLAVIAISLDNLTDDVLNQISVAAIGDSSSLHLGEQVVAIGNALGYGQSVTTGIVSALNREIATDESGNTDGNTYIQTDAAINPGNSGGALFNMNGELVGINTAKIASSEIEGMGYAIPISEVYDMLEEMMNETVRTEIYSNQEKGYLGISGTDVTSDVSSTYGIPTGVYVYDVEDNGAAANAGIKKGDVIIKFDNKSVSSSSELQSLLSYYKAGETVTVTVQSQGNAGYEEKEIQVTLGASSSATTDNATDNATEGNGSYNQQMPSDSYNTPYNNTTPYGYGSGSQFA